MTYEALLGRVEESAARETEAPLELAPRRGLTGVFVGRLIAIEGPFAKVEVSGMNDGGACHAEIVGEVGTAAIGSEVAVMFAGGDQARALVIGPLHRTVTPRELEARQPLPPAKLVLDALEEITLRCGQACLTLTRAGKVLIRGKYISSRSSGVNRIKGGSVQIN